MIRGLHAAARPTQCKSGPHPNMDDQAAVDNPVATLHGNVGPDLEQSLIDRQVDAAVASQLEKGGQINASIKAALAHLTEAPT